MGIDYEYLAASLSSLAGLPVRLYRAGEFAGLYHHTKFKPDLAILEEEHIFANPGNVSYYMDENFLYYGLFRAERRAVALIIGPVAHSPVNHTLAVRILRAMGENIGRAGELTDYFSAIPAYPLRNFLQILCTVNYFLNGEKLDVGQLLLTEEEMPSAQEAIPPERGEQEIHNTLALEEQMLACVEHGRVDEIQQLFQRPVEGRAGTLAADALRHGGRLAVITFHSLEDRIEKQTLRRLAAGCTCPPEFPVCVCGKKPKLTAVKRKPVVAGARELAENPRARSAKLRVSERTEYQG